MAQAEVGAALARVERGVLDREARDPGALQQLQELAGEHGLGAAEVELAARLVVHARCRRADAGALLRCMLPRQAVGRETVLLLLGAFAGLSLRLKELVLKWIILVNRKLSAAATRALHALYDVLFHFVDYASLQGVLCRLLYMLTRRKDVTPLRVHKLMTLVKNLTESGQDVGPLLLLYDLYAKYAPETVLVIPARFSRPAATFFRAPDEGWKRSMDAVDRVVREQQLREADEPDDRSGITNGAADDDDDDAGTLDEDARARERRLLRTAKAAPSKRARDKQDLLPAARSKKTRGAQLNVDELASTRELGLALIKGTVAFPDRCTAILRDAMFQHLLCLDPREDQVLRLRHTLPHMIEEEFFALRESAAADLAAAGGAAAAARQAQLESQRVLLDAMADFCDFMQQTLPELESFVIRFLKNWNGVHHHEPVLRLTARMQPRAFQDLHRLVLRPLYRVFQDAEVRLKARIVQCVTELLRNWAEIDWERHMSAAVDNDDDDDVDSPAGDELLDEEDNRRRRRERRKPQTARQHRFVPMPGGVNYYKVMFELVHWVDQVLLAALIEEQDHVLLQCAAGAFFHCVADLHTRHRIPFVAAPSPGITYRLLLAPTPVGPEVICGLLTSYRQSFVSMQGFMRQHHRATEEARSQGRPAPLPLPVEVGLDKLSLFNSYVWDACNLLWNRRPLHAAPANAQTSTALFKHAEQVGLVQALEEVADSAAVDKAFSLERSVAFAGLAARFAEWRKADTANMSAELRTELLDHLAAKGCENVSDFLHSFIRRLVDRRKGEQAPRKQDGSSVAA